jgi:uracil-DNA glycosylase family 4
LQVSEQKDFDSLSSLNETIIHCRACPRLVEFREKIAKEKRKQYASQEYWGRGVPGFGDPKARLIIVGLAPGRHGANRTSRIFTGDGSARFLVRHLYEAGFANQPTSEWKGDGLSYKDAYITAVVRCVPPEDKPTMEERERCFPYFQNEIALLRNAKVILALGRIAFESIVKLAGAKYEFKKEEFKHGRKYILDNEFPIVYASYHPSPRNTNTGKMTDSMFSGLLRRIKKDLEPL